MSPVRPRLRRRSRDKRDRTAYLSRALIDRENTMAPPLLKLDDIHLTFGGTPLLEGVGLSVDLSAATAPASLLCSASPPA